MPTTIYDKAKYHYDREFPAHLPPKRAFVHTGMFLGWAMDRQLYSEWFARELSSLVKAFRERKITGAGVHEACDGVSSRMKC